MTIPHAAPARQLTPLVIDRVANPSSTRVDPREGEGEIAGCLPGWHDLADRCPIPLIGDAEGPCVPSDLPPVVDAHVHLFPDRVFASIWRWFERYGWAIRYKLSAPRVLEFLFARGVTRVVGLAYAHTPGLARLLNDFMAELARAEPRLVGLGTVLPGEPDAVAIVEEAFALGLAGLKLHCHVQCMSPDADSLGPIYEACERANKPVLLHAGREPALSHYACDPREICSAERVARVLENHPRLRLCVPHLGADEFDAYEALLGRFDNLWLDTTMTVGRFVEEAQHERLLHARPGRILYGTDFPNLPYAWDRELRALVDIGFRPAELESLLGGAAVELFGSS